MPKRVVYLFGAGSTQAERNHAGKSKNPKDLLISAITDRVTTAIRGKTEHSEVMDRFTDGPKNIEQFISLLDSMKVATYDKLSNDIKELFVKDIKDYTSDLDPFLMKSLMEMHKIEELKEDEDLAGIITTNYDILIDNAIRWSGRKINYGFSCKADWCTGEGLLLLKLHGSFDWTAEYPIRVAGSIGGPKEKTLWVPPGVQKAFACYPFNAIWGKAVELLDCDVLRVIGSSLSQNDWELLALLFRTQLLHGSGDYKTELIVHKESAEYIFDNYTFLRKRVKLPNIPWCTVDDAEWGKDSFNPFKFWIQCQGRQLKVEKGIEIDKWKHFSDLVEEGAGQ